MSHILIDLIPDSDTILKILSVDFCGKVKVNSQFSQIFGFRKLFNMSVKFFLFYEGFDLENILIYPVASKNFTTLDKIAVPAFL